jgi:hypothetical protein
MVEAPPLVGVAGANMTPHVDDGRVKEAEHRPEDEPSLVALTLRSLRGPGFSLSQEASLDDVMSIPGFSDITDLGIRELGLPGYP